MADEKDISVQEKLNELKARAIELATKERAYTEENAKKLTEVAEQYDDLLKSQVKTMIELQEKGDKLSDDEKEALKIAEKKVAAYRAQRKEITALEKHMDKLRKKTQEAADAIGEFAEGIMGITPGWEKSVTGALINIRRGTIKAEEAAAMLAERFEESFSAAALEYSMVAKLQQALMAYAAMSMAVTVEIDKGIASFEKATSASDNYREAIERATMANLAFGVTGEGMAESFGALQERLIDLTPTAGGTGQELAELSAKMGILGVDTQNQGKLFFTLMKGMNMTEKSAKKYALRVADLSKKLKMGLAATVANLNELMPTLLVHGDKATKVFENLSAMARKAGISVNTLMGAVGQTFDTFEGAANATQALNAILGGPYLNAIDMVHKTEDERAKSLVNMFQASGRAYRDLDRYSKKAIMHQLNISDAAEAEAFFALSVDEANNLLRDRASAAKAQENLNQSLIKATPAIDAFMNAVKLLGVSLVPMLDHLRVAADIIRENIGVFKTLTAIVVGGGLAFLAYYKIVQFQMMLAMVHVAKKGVVLSGILATVAGAQSTVALTGKAAGTGMTAAGSGAAAAAPGFAAVGLTIAAVVASVGLLIGSLAALEMAFSDPPDMSSLSNMDPEAISNLEGFMTSIDDAMVSRLEEIADSFERIGDASQKMKPMTTTMFGKQVMAKLVGIEEGTAARTAAGTAPAAQTVAAAGGGTTVISDASLYLEVAPEMKPTLIGKLRDMVLGDDMNVIIKG